MKQVPKILPAAPNNLNGLVWDGILRHHFIFSPFLFFATLPHRISPSARFSQCWHRVSGPLPPPCPQQPQIRSQPPLKKTMISTLENVQSKLLIAAIPGPPVCLVPALASILSYNPSSEGVGTPRLRHRLRSSNIDRSCIFVFSVLIKLCRIADWANLKSSQQQLQ